MPRAGICEAGSATHSLDCLSARAIAQLAVQDCASLLYGREPNAELRVWEWVISASQPGDAWRMLVRTSAREDGLLFGLRPGT